jgi:hypothetical protein
LIFDTCTIAPVIPARLHRHEVAVDLHIDLVGEVELQFTELALRHHGATLERHLDARRDRDRIFANA